MPKVAGLDNAQSYAFSDNNIACKIHAFSTTRRLILETMSERKLCWVIDDGRQRWGHHHRLMKRQYRQQAKIERHCCRDGWCSGQYHLALAFSAVVYKPGASASRWWRISTASQATDCCQMMRELQAMSFQFKERTLSVMDLYGESSCGFIWCVVTWFCQRFVVTGLVTTGTNSSVQSLAQIWACFLAMAKASHTSLKSSMASVARNQFWELTAAPDFAEEFERVCDDAQKPEPHGLDQVGLSGGEELGGVRLETELEWVE